MLPIRDLLSVLGRRAAAVVSCLIIALPVWSQTVIPGIPEDGIVTLEQIESAVTAVEAQDGLDEETRGRVIDLLRDAQAQIQDRAAAEMAAEDFAASIETSPDETQRVQAQIDSEPVREPTDASLGLSAGITLGELQAVLARETAALTGSEAQLSRLESDIATEEARPTLVRQRIQELRASRDQLNEQLDTAPPAGESPVLTDARRLAAAVRLEAVDAELRRLDQETLSHGVRTTLLNARRDLAEQIVARQRARVAYLQERVNRERQAVALSAQQEAAMTERAVADKHPVVRALAEGNAELTRELPDIAAAIERSTEQINDIQKRAQQLEQGLTRSRQRLEIAGVSQVIGGLFAEERRNLPTVDAYRADLRKRRQEMAEIGLAQVRIDEERRELTSIDNRVVAAMEEVQADVSSEEEIQNIEAEVRLLLQNRRDLLNQAAGTYTSYMQAMGDLDVAQRRLVNAADEYRQFLDQHLLWIPSTTVFGLDTLRDLPPSIAWTLSPSSWRDVAGSLLEEMRDNPIIALLALIVLSGLWFATGMLRRRFDEISARVGRLSTDTISLTLRAIAIVVVRAIPLPLTLAILGWTLVSSPAATDFTLAVSASLLVVSPFLYNLTLYRSLFAKNGVANIHFGLIEPRLRQIRRLLAPFTVISVPVLFVTALAYSSPITAHRDSLGRLAFIALMLLLGVVVYRLLRVGRSDAEAAATSTEALQVPGRPKRFWHLLAAGAPILLAAIAVFGYLHTAVILSGQLVDTIWLFLALVVLYVVVLRWLSLTRRKIAWQRAIKEREVRRAESQKGPTGTEVESDTPVVDNKPIDLDEVDQQTRRLLRAGLVFIGVVGTWSIWSDVLPALNILEQISIWTQTATIDGQETIVPVTLADLLLALLILVVTYIAAKNLPGLMEIAVLQRLTLQPGSRYTINTLLRYLVVAIGVISVLGIIGWDWSRIQWLVAALGVGLGFGLQEIVANFVSGLVILFERPVRVGDTVTVGEITGTVSRIRIRATTITDWDRKEIVVPNKSFITEQVVNWTLSDPITRIVIPIGISYGSDVKLAHEVMENALRNQPLILDQPEPKAYFIGFGESSLDFKLFVYSRELGDRLPITHAVHEDILQALRDRNIKIPFPQRDLHLRSSDDDIWLSKDGSGKSDPAK